MRPRTTPVLGVVGRRRRAVVCAVPIALFSCILILSSAGRSDAAGAVDLGSAGTFAVLAGSAISNTGSTTIDGDVGSFPRGSLHATNAVSMHDGR